MFDMRYTTNPLWLEIRKNSTSSHESVNSIKYGKEKGLTEVSIEDLTNEKVIVRITDNGEGIEKKIFLDF
jgi:two-component system phosphate regulon sensor histidine kinase PhoR